MLFLYPPPLRFFSSFSFCQIRGPPPLSSSSALTTIFQVFLLWGRRMALPTPACQKPPWHKTVPNCPISRSLSFFVANQFSFTQSTAPGLFLSNKRDLSPVRGFRAWLGLLGEFGFLLSRRFPPLSTTKHPPFFFKRVQSGLSCPLLSCYSFFAPANSLFASYMPPLSRLLPPSFSFFVNCWMPSLKSRNWAARFSSSSTALTYSFPLGRAACSYDS